LTEATMDRTVGKAVFTLVPWKTGQQIVAATNESIEAKAVFNLAPWETGQQIGTALLVMLYLIGATMNGIVAKALFVYLGYLLPEHR
jgi:hypothetical protein